MRAKGSMRRCSRRRKTRKTLQPLRSFMMITACAFTAIVIAVGSQVIDNSEKDRVYAAAESEEDVARFVSESQEAFLPTGIAGVVSGVQETPSPGSTVNRIGTSCEQVMVGQRVKKVEENVTEFNISSSMEATVDHLEAAATDLSSTPKMMSDADYNTLLSIVEAEAGGEDLKGKILVANVILNRVESDQFPDTVTDVVWEYVDGVPQFSPTYDGRIYTVTVSDETREAVKQALEGVDYSEGALFFIQKSAAESHNVTWFEKDLVRLFKHGVHEFYTYPEEQPDEKI